MRKREKALLFVEHIERHLEASDGLKYKLYGNPKVICKICGKTIDQIAEEAEEATPSLAVFRTVAVLTTYAQKGLFVSYTLTV
jgi:hypothetical protein